LTCQKEGGLSLAIASALDSGDLSREEKSVAAGKEL
jgi:hypothetical protein